MDKFFVRHSRTTRSRVPWYLMSMACLAGVPLAKRGVALLGDVFADVSWRLIAYWERPG